MSDQRFIEHHGKRVRVMTREEAQECLGRFINSHFRNRGSSEADKREMARFTIPTDLENDDDMLMSAFIESARQDRERLKALMPLFEEARDALPAISEASARVRGVRLDLADRMDDVGNPERWAARVAGR